MTCRGYARLTLATLVAVAAVTINTGADGSRPSAAATSIARLKDGNVRFVRNPSEALPIDVQQRTALAKGQSPYAIVLSCADPRVPPEVIFRAGLGELFVVRAAGHVPDHSVLASVEYAAEHLHVPVVVVMGHEMCGAVKAAIDTPATTSLGPNPDYLLKAIRPAVGKTSTSAGAGRLRAAILQNVDETIRELSAQSAILRHLAERGQLAFVGAYYELASGRVHFSEPAALSGPAGGAHRH